ncbi:MAG: nucleotidyl transferase AbiEii/AbiGii toxin family protein [Mycoplasmataceae bacterium]|jgi:predicted nucleotidyltransferase component of viral defense system|nr:nucleotidyl transferase AbiEii/AbiGii toxin family protein [Mycoplasmataceae bacterium]
MNEFLNFLFKNTNRFVFKGGSCLYKFYDLDRFSEDLDFDSEKGNIANIVKKFCQIHHLPSPSERKDTNKGQKFFINYGVIGRTLKIETSLRNKSINKENIKKEGIFYFYDINVIAMQKADAFRNRDKIRDLYDLCFIANKYYEKLIPEVQDELKQVLMAKGIQQYDYVVKEQTDQFIDIDKLQDMILQAFTKLKITDK